MADKLTSGAVVYRGKGSGAEWFLIKSKTNDLELPKVLVRPGESSVQAILRFLRENFGVKGAVLEEAGRTRASTTIKGKTEGVHLIFYLLRGDFAPEEGLSYIEGEWLPYTSARRKLPLIREQKMLSQANMVLKQWRKKRRQKLA